MTVWLDMKILFRIFRMQSAWGRFHMAYLFGGEHGAGKKLLASLFAMTLQCEEHGVEPCMKCRSCRKALGKNHPDIINVTHEKPNSIGIDEIREQLINDVGIKPYESPYKDLYCE